MPGNEYTDDFNESTSPVSPVIVDRLLQSYESTLKGGCHIFEDGSPYFCLESVLFHQRSLQFVYYLCGGIHIPVPTYLSHVSNPDASVILVCNSAGYFISCMCMLVTFRKIFIYLCILSITTVGIHCY